MTCFFSYCHCVSCDIVFRDMELRTTVLAQGRIDLRSVLLTVIRNVQLGVTWSPFPTQLLLVHIVRAQYNTC